MKSKDINITINQQKYIETIFELSIKDDHKHAHAKEIAETLNIRMASVTEGLQNLSKKGVVNYKVRCPVTLTQEGHRIAKELAKRENALKYLFHNIMGCSKNRADDIACQVEHIIDKQFRDRLTTFIEFIENKVDLKGQSFKDAFIAFNEQKENDLS